MRLINSNKISHALATATAGLCFLVVFVTSAAEPRWPQFRGPSGNGIADGEKPPTCFGTGSNVAWQVDLPSGVSSPCIWGNRIFLTTFSDGKLSTVCIDRLDGHTRWQRTAPTEKIEPFHPSEGSPASATPRSEEHTSELQSLRHLVCRLLLEKKNKPEVVDGLCTD